MQTQMVRTTISLPRDVHEEWRLEAVKKRISLGKVILEKTGKIKKGKKLSIEERIKKDFELFDRVGRSCLQIDLVKALRKDRDRDNA